MKKTVAVVLCTLLGSLQVLAQSTPPDKKPHHCSVEKSNNELRYPDSLRGSGIQGTVGLEAVVDQGGCASGVRVVRKLHPELDKIAKDAVNSWKFHPAMKDGKLVIVKVPIEVSFKDPGK